jgi:hypothetical protein
VRRKEVECIGSRERVFGRKAKGKGQKAKITGRDRKGGK